ncbi:FIST signal transduction protein [Desulfovibrio sp. JC022]|uniref:FIST signal transduction protein n=1 Tax=Desulfovibrio sp. JC022 TaxID=2593642 RepID=UPI0013D1D9F4|nr:FIST C-terminal domain-containing protein [Desulfovibrio sp. JC022]NDV24177.1 histidine kinase [Desulfovibrio sp. JC022]
MHFELERTGSAQAFETVLKTMYSRNEVKGIIVFACDKNGFKPENLDHILKDCPVPIAGGIFPGIVHQKETLETGTLVIGLSHKPDLSIIREMSNPDTDFMQSLRDVFNIDNIPDTIFVLTDGFSSRISSFINAMFVNIGLERNIVGGGAGSLSLEKRPCIITNEGLLEDASIVALLDTKSTVNISHGWHPIKGPFKVTEADRNVIKSINWMPAFNTYREVIREHSGQYITPDNFSRIAMSYPFGISRMCCDPIVRDPVMVDETGALTCVGEIVEGAFVNILHGNPESLIYASSKLPTCTAGFSLGDNSVGLIIDCISRALFLKDRFKHELDAIHLPDIPLLGFLSFGEIATQEKQFLEFHNKTTVLSILEEL